MPKLPSRGGPARLELYPYQQEGVKFLKAHPRALLADEMGLGKTSQLLHASEGRTLIIAPKMVLTGGAWEDEIHKWMTFESERFTQAPYTSLNAREGRKVTDRLRPEYEGPWDTVILDESHYIKGRGTSWTKLIDKLCKQADQVFAATGTPIPNWAPELFTTLRVLHPGEAKPGGAYGSYWKWADLWFDTTPETIYVKGQPKEVPNVGTLKKCTVRCQLRPADDPCEHYHEFFAANLGEEHFLRRLRDDVLTQLPPLTTEQVLCPMVPSQARLYQQVKKEALAELSDGSLRVAWAETSGYAMCEKIATGVEILDPGAKGSGKLDRLRMDLESRSRPTLVVAHFQASVEAARAAAESVGASARHIHGGVSDKDREEAVKLFKSGQLDVLVGSLETIAEGLTLTAADVCIFLEASYKPARNEQAKRRIHRPGQDRPCTILEYVTPRTVDEHKRELLATKTDHQLRALSPAQIKKLL